MRSWRSSALSALALLALAAPASAADSAARRFARATAQASRALSLAAPDAQRAADARRQAGAACLDTWRAAPPERRDDLFELYFLDVSGGLWSRDGTILTRWATALSRIPGVSASTPLRRARAAVRTEMSLARAAYDHPADACTVAKRWQDAGWTEDSIPAEVLKARAFLVRSTNTRVPDTRPAQRLLRRHGGHDGARAAALLARGPGEPTARVIRGCDEVLLALEPAQAPPNCS